MYLAAYTSPINGNAGYRWIWRHPVLNEALCTACYAQIEKPTDIAFWSNRHFRAGLFKYDQNWLVLYRFLDAGRDSLGRLGRFFLVVGFIGPEEVFPFSVERTLISPVFSTVSEEKPDGRNLEIEIGRTSDAKQEATGSLVSRESGELHSWNEINKAAIDCMCSGSGRAFHLTIIGKENGIIGKLTTDRSSEPTIPYQSAAKPRPQESLPWREPESEGKPTRIIESLVFKIGVLVFVFAMFVAVVTTSLLSRLFPKATVPAKPLENISPADKKPQNMQPAKASSGPHLSPSPSKITKP